MLIRITWPDEVLKWQKVTGIKGLGGNLAPKSGGVLCGSKSGIAQLMRISLITVRQ